MARKYIFIFFVIAGGVIANFLAGFSPDTTSRFLSAVFSFLALAAAGYGLYCLRRDIFGIIPRLGSILSSLKDRNLKGEHELDADFIKTELGNETEELFKSFKMLFRDLLAFSSSINISMSQIWQFLNSNMETIANQKQHGDQLSDASEEMTRMALDIANNAGSAAKLSVEVTRDAENGMKSMELAISSIHDLSDATANLSEMVSSLNRRIEEVGGIINIINDIADQTNLLALNAAIEAARAGEQGRGFAVVADEVRKLAERTMSATADIGHRISGIQSDSKKTASQMEVSRKNVDTSVAHIDSARKALGGITEIAKKSDEKISKIASSIHQQSTSTEQISKSIDAFAQTVITTNDEICRMTQEFVLLSKDINNLTDYLATFQMPEDIECIMEFFKIAHKNWVQKLYRMYYSDETIDPSRIASHENCRLGKWYFSREADCYRSNPEFLKIEMPHQKIHDLAWEAAAAYQNGDTARSLVLIKELDSVSRNLVELFEQFKQAALRKDSYMLHQRVGIAGRQEAALNTLTSA